MSVEPDPRFFPVVGPPPTDFRSDTPTHPGEKLRRELAARGMSQADLASRTGLSAKHVNQVVQGVALMSADVAIALERVLGTPASVWTRLITMTIAGLEYGPMGSFIPELFRTRYRYTAAGVSYNLAGVVGGAVPPLAAAAITAAFGGFGVGVFLAFLCLVATTCTFALRETRNVDMEEPDAATESPRATV